MGRASALALAVVLFAEASWAAPPAIQAQTSCPALAWSGRAFVDLLRVELKADRIDVTVDGSVQDAPILVTQPDGCTDAARGATLVLRRGDQRSERHVDLADVPANAKARVLALAAADLLRAAFAAPVAPAQPPPPMELHIVVDAPPPAPPRTIVVPAPPPPPPPPPARAFTLALAGEARSFPSANTGLFGARATLAAPLGHYLVLGVDGDFGAGSARDALGDVSTLVVGGGVGVAFAAGPEALRFHLGPKLEVDWVRFSPNAALATTVASVADSVVALLALSATMHVLVAGGVHALIGIDAGAALRGFEARADAHTVTGIVGPVLGLRVGIAWSPGMP